MFYMIDRGHIKYESHHVKIDCKINLYGILWIVVSRESAKKYLKIQLNEFEVKKNCFQPMAMTLPHSMVFSFWMNEYKIHQFSFCMQLIQSEFIQTIVSFLYSYFGFWGYDNFVVVDIYWFCVFFFFCMIFQTSSILISFWIAANSIVNESTSIFHYITCQMNEKHTDIISDTELWPVKMSF